MVVFPLDRQEARIVGPVELRLPIILYEVGFVQVRPGIRPDGFKGRRNFVDEDIFPTLHLCESGVTVPGHRDDDLESSDVPRGQHRTVSYRSHGERSETA